MMGALGSWALGKSGSSTSPRSQGGHVGCHLAACIQRCARGGLKPAAQFALSVGGGGVPWAAASSPLETRTAPGRELSIPPQGYPRAAPPMAALVAGIARAPRSKSVLDVEN